MEHRFHDERERRQSTNKRNEGHGNTVSMRLIRVDTRYWHALGERYYLLILWRQLLRLAAIAGQCFGSISKVFNALIIVLPKVISGAPLGLLCGSQEDSRRLGKRSKGMRLTCPSHRSWRRAMYLSIESKPSSVSISLVGIWYIRDWASVMWLVTHS